MFHARVLITANPTSFACSSRYCVNQFNLDLELVLSELQLIYRSTCKFLSIHSLADSQRQQAVAAIHAVYLKLLYGLSFRVRLFRSWCRRFCCGELDRFVGFLGGDGRFVAGFPHVDDSVFAGWEDRSVSHIQLGTANDLRVGSLVVVQNRVRLQLRAVQFQNTQTSSKQQQSNQSKR